MNSKEISSKKFEKAKGFGGYRVDDVEDFMDRITEYVAALEEEKRDLEKKLAVLADKLEEYRADEDSLRTALLGAQKLGDGVIKESKTKAEIILRDANIKAERIVNDAYSKAEEEQRRLESIKRSVSDFKRTMIELYRRHLETIMQSIPEVQTAPEPPEAQEPAAQPEEKDQGDTQEFVMDTARTGAPEQEEELPAEEPQEARRPVLQTAGNLKVLSMQEEDAESKYGMKLEFGESFPVKHGDEKGFRRRK